MKRWKDIESLIAHSFLREAGIAFIAVKQLSFMDSQSLEECGAVNVIVRRGRLQVEKKNGGFK